MVALAGARRSLHLAQQCVHLLRCEAAACSHAAVAGIQRAHGFEAIQQRPWRSAGIAGTDLGVGCVGTRQIADETHDTAAIGTYARAEQRGHLADRNRARAKAVDHQSELLQLSGTREEKGGLVAIQLDDHRDQQPLAGDAAIGEHRLHALINEAFMRRVLIDDDDRVLGLGDDVSGMNLGARRAQRTARQFGRRRGSRRRSVGGGCVEAKGGLEGRGEITQRDLVRNALRMRPDRIIIGEVRGAEAFDMLQAMNTGHDGSMSTIHANTTRDALTRIENMVQMGNMGLPSRAIRTQIVGAIDLIVQVERQRDGGRRVTQVTEVCGMEGEVITLNDVFQFEVLGEGPDGKLFGRYKVSRVPPSFQRRLAYFGLEAAWKAALDEAAA